MKSKFLQVNKKLMVIAGLVAVVLIAVAGTTPPVHPQIFKNLKVLPKDISNEDLHKIMDQFNQALGVRCNYCHAQKDTSRHLDFASDSNHVKDGARYMMHMTMEINNKYLQVKNPMIGDTTLVVTCWTCHRGSPFPDNKSRDTIARKDFMPHRDANGMQPPKDSMPH